jgi:hypothetical protein
MYSVLRISKHALPITTDGLIDGLVGSLMYNQIFADASS